MRRPEVSIARKLRKEMSLPEAMLWQRLRGSKTGLKFRRQHPIGPYVVDFCCLQSRLAVEIEGEVHNIGNRPARDLARICFIEENGFRVVRVAAARVMKDADATADAIAALAVRPLHQPAAGPPPRAGEDQE